MLNQGDNASWKRLKASAYHEAGHSVAAWHMSYWLGEVSVRWGTRREGSQSKGHSNMAGLVANMPAQNEAVVCVSGFAAERRFNPAADPDVSSHTDFDDAARALGFTTPVTQYDGKRDAAIERMLSIADEILSDEWPVVENLASALLVRETLTGPEVAEILRVELQKLGLVPANARVLRDDDGTHAILVAVPRSWGTVFIRPPQSRLRAAATKARERYVQLTPAEIAAVWTPTVEIVAMPDRPEKVTSRVVNVEHIVVVTPSGPVQPSSVLELPGSASNAFGASVSWKGMSATFPLDVLKEGNTVHVILDQPVIIHDESGSFVDGPVQRAKDDPVPFTSKMLGRLKGGV